MTSSVLVIEYPLLWFTTWPGWVSHSNTDRYRISTSMSQTSILSLEDTTTALIYFIAAVFGNLEKKLKKVVIGELKAIA